MVTMSLYKNKKLWLILLITVFVGGFYWFLNSKHQEESYTATKSSDEVHVHSDFMMYLNDERVRFTDDKYQSYKDHVMMEDFHFHDGSDEVIHRHADGLTLAVFLGSLGYTFTQDCLTNDAGAIFCADDKNVLRLYVNNQIIEDVTSYIPQDSDRILVYYGTPDNPKLADYLSEITSNACIYSYTCPEKGTPPPESCGLTCEL